MRESIVTRRPYDQFHRIDDRTYSRVPDIRGPLAIDASHGPYAGWEVGPTGKSRLWAIDKENMKRLGAIDWGALAQIGAQTGSQIATARWGNPPEGTYIQQGANVYSRQSPNSPFTYPGLNVGGSGITTLVLVGGVVLGLIVIMGARK